MSENDIVVRLRNESTRLGLSQTDLARLYEQTTGRTMGPSAINKIFHGKRDIKAREADALLAIINSEKKRRIHSRMNIKHDVTELDRVSIEAEHLTEINEGDEYAGYIEDEYRPMTPGGIPELDVHAGAGEGQVGEVINISLGGESYSGHAVVGEWTAPDGYVRHELNLAPGKSIVLTVIGDSMAPTFLPGDKIVVDLRYKDLVHDGVYVISDGSSPPQVKRLTRVLFTAPAMVKIGSDNQVHGEQTAELANVKIIGRVAGRITRQ